MNWELPSVLFVLLFCWYMYQPIPEGFSQPWKLRALSLSYKVICDICWLGDRLRIGTFSGNFMSLFAVEVPTHDRIKVMEFDGVPVRTYNLEGSSGEMRPGFVFYHGGGWMLGTPHTYDPWMLSILDVLDIAIVSVDYRLADGKIKFPAPLEDCLIATRYFINNAHQFNVDSGRIAIGGDSSGGNLAAAASLKLRDTNFRPLPKAQVLIYPPLQAIDFGLPSHIQNAEGPLLSRYFMAWAWSLYGAGIPEYGPSFVKNRHTIKEVKLRMSNTHIRHEDIDEKYKYAPYKTPELIEGKEKMWSVIERVMTNPYFAPLLAEDFYDLPETYIYTAQGDVLRDEGFLYVKKLQAAMVPVRHVHADTACHGMCMFQQFKEGKECVQSFITFLQERL